MPRSGRKAAERAATAYEFFSRLPTAQGSGLSQPGGGSRKGKSNFGNPELLIAAAGLTASRGSSREKGGPGRKSAVELCAEEADVAFFPPPTRGTKIGRVGNYGWLLGLPGFLLAVHGPLPKSR
jgi:hypothetical protein